MVASPKPELSLAVGIVDDDRLVLDALTSLLQTEGFDVDAYASPSAFFSACEPARYGCLILDVAMPEMNGLALQQALAARDIHVPVIFLTGQASIPMAVQALKEGAVDFLEKPVDPDKLLDSIRAAMREHAAREAELRKAQHLKKALEQLTPREKEIIAMVASGLSTKEIARRLDISHRTVEGHRQRARDKMKAGSLAELVEMARLCGLTG
jgi:two-component system, LuxR family, response regulator FixJ